MFDLILGIIVAGGLVGVAVLMFAENIVPPIPSEVIMPLAGFAAAQGDLNFAGVVAAGAAGATAGAYVWYAVGRRVSEARLERWIERHGRWLTLDASDLERSRTFFRRRGALAVFLGRLAPGVRTFVSVPAGVMRMPQIPFMIATTLGTAIWTAMLAAAGYLLEQEYERVAAWLDPVSAVVITALVAAYLIRAIRWRRRSSPSV